MEIGRSSYNWALFFAAHLLLLVPLALCSVCAVRKLSFSSVDWVPLSTQV
jgi:hypothetical protein